jgi:hypothetical protein
MMRSRLEAIKWFYEILDDIEQKVGGKRYLSQCTGRMNWPKRGVYFFFEHGEERSNSGSGLRVVRVGTHAIKADSKSTLWQRLRTHRGTRLGGGNHRASIFRRYIGSAIMAKKHVENQFQTWGEGHWASKEVRQKEHVIEQEVSQYIGEKMPFLWLEVDDPPHPESERALIERNAIALVSNYPRPFIDEIIDPPSDRWLGKYSPSEKIRKSGLWNEQHVDELWDFNFLERLERFARKMKS